MAWYDNPGTVAGAAAGSLLGPGGTAMGAAIGGGGSQTKAGKAIGKTIAGWNPYAKGPTYTAQNVNDAPQITAPAFDPNAFKGAPTVGGPTTFQGATINAVADPRAAIIDQTNSNEWRAQQQSLAQQLALQASGQGPSLAAEQFNQAQRANIAQNFATMASARGGPNAGNARLAAQQNAAVQAQTARDAAMGRIQEQLAARQQLGGVLESARTGDINLATSQAMMQNEAGLAKYKGDLERAIAQGNIDQDTAARMFEAAVGNARQNAQMTANYNVQYNDLAARYAAMGLSAQEANQAAAMQIQAMRLGEYSKAQQSAIDASNAQKTRIAGLINQAGGIGAMVATGGASKAAAPAAGAGASSMLTQQEGGGYRDYDTTPQEGYGYYTQGNTAGPPVPDYGTPRGGR